MKELSQVGKTKMHKIKYSDPGVIGRKDVAIIVQ